jgi:cytochrome c oxidase subunit 1
MPRRVYTYLPETGWGTLNAVATLGAALIALSVLVFIITAQPPPWFAGRRQSVGGGYARMGDRLAAAELQFSSHSGGHRARAAVGAARAFVGSVFTPWAVLIGAIPVTVALIGWFWPTQKEHQEELAAEAQR